MKCLEVRIRADGVKRRRYARSGLPNLTTLELPLTVLASVGMARVEAALAQYRRGEEARARAAALRSAVAKRAGQPASAVARDLKVSVERVRQLRKEHGNEEQPRRV